VYVELQQDDEALHLFIQDNGIGFDVHAAQERATRGSSLGLLGMQERVLFADGQIEIQSSPGNGTEIQARFPLQAYQSHPGSTQRYE
jgi:signal transduction histidine kinase